MNRCRWGQRRLREGFPWSMQARACGRLLDNPLDSSKKCMCARTVHSTQCVAWTLSMAACNQLTEHECADDTDGSVGTAQVQAWSGQLCWVEDAAGFMAVAVPCGIGQRMVRSGPGYTRTSPCESSALPFLACMHHVKCQPAKPLPPFVNVLLLQDVQRMCRGRQYPVRLHVNLGHKPGASMVVQRSAPSSCSAKERCHHYFHSSPS